MTVGVSWGSSELDMALATLSGQQARGIIRIVQAELEGKSISSLLDCPGQICTSTTYYGSGKRKGWRGKLEFQTALRLARRDYRAWLREHGTGETLTILASASPDAARALKQHVVGDDGAIAALERLLAESENPEERKQAARELGATGQPRVVASLTRALVAEQTPSVREVLIAALGDIAAWRDGEQRSAAAQVLDRADVKTATKQTVSVSESDLDAEIERELEKRAQEMMPVDL